MTGANGCSNTAQVTVVVNPLPTVTAGSNSPVCVGSTLNLTSSGGVLYSWAGPNTFVSSFQNPSIASISAAGAGIYIVTVTNANGCSNTGQVIVNVSSNPAGFSFNQYDNCEDKAVLFTHTGTNITSYLWNFGDPISSSNTSTAANPSHVFIHPGYYQVTLTTKSPQCGTVSSSQIIYIIPSTSTYNSNCCIKNHTYVNNFPGHAPNSIDITITPALSGISTPIHVTTSMQIKGTLMIKQGAGLIVDPGVQINFGPQGKIIVEQGALLTLDGATLTSISGMCNLPIRLMWMGVEVWGVANNNKAVAQGQIIMKNGAKVEDAHIGVMLGKREWIWQGPPVNKFMYNGHVSSAGGGIIKADNSFFNRNAQAIKFWEYLTPNFSNIKNCAFTCKVNNSNTTLTDPYYKLNGDAVINAYNDIYLAAHNPFENLFMGSIIGNAPAIPYYFINMYNIKRVILRDNIFERAFVGISSTDAKYDVRKGTGTGHDFKNIISTGINATNTISPLSGNIYDDIRFTGVVNAEMVISGSRFDVIKNNQFNPLGIIQTNSLPGIDIANSTNFTIADNEFSLLSSGIRVTNCAGSASSLIGFLTKGNIFTQCKIGVQPMAANNFLTIKCNTHHNPVAANYINNWNNTGVLGQQGSFVAPSPTANQKLPAGNIFNPATGAQIIHRQIKTSSSFNYYAHTAPADRCPTAVGPVSINCGSAVATSVACIPAVNPGCLPCERQAISSDSTQISGLLYEFNNMLANLDKGQTNSLLSAIAGSMPDGNLKNALINASPLSDTLLLAYINRNNVSPGHFKEVMIPNSPVSDKVVPSLNVKLNELSPGIAKQVREVQVVNQGVQTLTSIARNITFIEKNRQIMLNNVIAHYLNADSADVSLALLENETTIEARQTLAAEYINQGNYAEAISKLLSLPSNSVADAAFISLYSIYIDLFSNGKTLWEMDPSQIATINSIANLCPASLATDNAKAALQVVFGIHIPDCNINSTGRNIDSSLIYSSKRGVYDQSFLGTNIPNPFSRNTIIPYYIPDGQIESVLVIQDLAGRILQSYSLQSAQNQIEVSMNQYDSGIYFYSLIQNGVPVQTKKMILVK